MENLLASALPVADAVSFEFDGINVTAQHVMARSVPLMRLLAFYDQFSIAVSTIAVVEFRRIDVFMKGHVSEKWDTNG